MSVVGRSAVVAAVGGAVVGGYLGLVTGALPVDLGIGRPARSARSASTSTRRLRWCSTC